MAQKHNPSLQMSRDHPKKIWEDIIYTNFRRGFLLAE